jgi:hypothetical protein
MPLYRNIVCNLGVMNGKNGVVHIHSTTKITLYIYRECEYEFYFIYLFLEGGGGGQYLHTLVSKIERKVAIWNMHC